MGYTPKAFGHSAQQHGIHAVMDLFGPSAAANLGSGILQLPDVLLGNIYFEIGGLVGETVSVYISTDGTNYSAALLPFDLTTGLHATAATLGNGRYRINLDEVIKPKFVKFVKSAAVEVAAVAVAVPSQTTNF